MGTQEARENADGTGGAAVTWSNAMDIANRSATESGTRHAVLAFYFTHGRAWRYYVLRVGSRPWENAVRYAPRERLSRYGL